ncbi:unnamed protein product [Urochloa decumbens]|uniref:Uncharacterized protein n=1 Tax=Urochloa decumbens TaxID=240449 RepID=A0ABC9ASX5_9POAL
MSGYSATWEWLEIFKLTVEFYRTKCSRFRSLLPSHCCLAFVLAGPVFVPLVLFIFNIFLLCIAFWVLVAAFYFVMSLYGFIGPIVCIALAWWRLMQHDYGDTDGDVSNGNLKPALILFYSLIICQFVLYMLVIIGNTFVGIFAVPIVCRCSKLTQEWGYKSVKKYLSDTTEKCWREGSPASIADRSLSRYAADLLDSESGEDNLLGARMLATFIRHGADVRSLLLPSRPKIQKLIGTMGWRGQDGREMRECATGIVAHLAGDIHLHQFPGALRYHEVGDDDSGKKVGSCNKLILQGLVILERLASDRHNCSDICTTPGLLAKITAPLYSATFKEDVEIHDWAEVVSGSLKVLNQIIRAPVKAGRRVRREIVSNKQAMCNLEWILEQSNGADQELQIQAMEIMTQLALDASNNLSDYTKKTLIGKELETFIADGKAPGSTLDRLKATAGRMLVLLSTNSKANFDSIRKATEVIIQDKENSSAHLTEIAEDKKTIVDHFIEITEGNSNVSHLTKLLDATNNITYRTIAAGVLETFCTHCDWNKHKQIVMESLLPKVITEIMSIKIDRPESKISDGKEKPQAKRWSLFKKKNNRGNEENLKASARGKDEENPQKIALGTEERNQGCAPRDRNMIQETSSGDQKKSSGQQNEEQTTSTKELQEALLSLARVICDKMISAGDVVQMNTLGGEAFVAKLKTIIDDNCKPTADSLKTVKLCGWIAASMMQCQVYAELFRNKEFVQSLSKASKIMSSLESCMLFAGTDFRLKKTIRPLLSKIVSELEQKARQSV